MAVFEDARAAPYDGERSAPHASSGFDRLPRTISTIRLTPKRPWHQATVSRIAFALTPSLPSSATRLTDGVAQRSQRPQIPNALSASSLKYSRIATWRHVRTV